MTFEQKGDVRCYVTPDGIEINVENGLAEMAWFESAINLCLAGGNMEDAANPSTASKEWMGNEDEEPENRFRSRFMHMLNGRPMSSQLIRDLGEAASLDIIDGFGSYINSASCVANIDGLDKITLKSKLEMKDGKNVEFLSEFYK